MQTWRQVLRGDPVPWLLEASDPAVRHLTLVQLLDEPQDAPIVRRARSAAMRCPPIVDPRSAGPEGWWV